MPWLYPPTFLLMVAPIAVLPYFPALALWQSLPFGGFMLVMSRVGLPSLLFWLLPFSAAIAQTLISGQNGLLSATIMAAGLICLERRARLAGVLFGIMTFKPQLAILIVPALIAGRHWVALATMSITVGLLMICSVAVFGVGSWVAFIENLYYVQGQAADGRIPWARMPTVFIGLRMAGVDPTVARVAQGLCALMVLSGVMWVWWRPLPYRLKAALLVAAVPLATPFAYDYDLVILLLPLAWLILDDQRRRLGHLEIALMVLIWTLPAWWMKQIIRGDRDSIQLSRSSGLLWAHSVSGTKKSARG